MVVDVQSPSHVRLFVTTWTAARQASLSFTISWNLTKFMSIELVMPSNQLILWCPFLLLPSIFPSIRVFSNELALRIRWPKYWIFGISPSSEYSGFPLVLTGLVPLQSKGLSSLLQHHSWKASVLWCSAFFMVQLSHLYVTTRKTVAWLYEPLSAKWCLCFLIHCLKFVIAFPPRSKCLLISWLQSPSSVILEPKKIKSLHCLHFFPHLLTVKWWD